MLPRNALSLCRCKMGEILNASPVVLLQDGPECELEYIQGQKERNIGIAMDIKAVFKLDIRRGRRRVVVVCN